MTFDNANTIEADLSSATSTSPSLSFGGGLKLTITADRLASTLKDENSMISLCGEECIVDYTTSTLS